MSWPYLRSRCTSLYFLLPYFPDLQTKIALKIAKIASAYGKSPAQVLLSWAVQRGTSVIPKTVHQDRMIENRDLCQLSEIHMAEINSLVEKKGAVRYLDPRNHIGFDIFREDADEPIEEKV